MMNWLRRLFGLPPRVTLTEEQLQEIVERLRASRRSADLRRQHRMRKAWTGKGEADDRG